MPWEYLAWEDGAAGEGGVCRELQRMEINWKDVLSKKCGLD